MPADVELKKVKPIDDTLDFTEKEETESKKDEEPKEVKMVGFFEMVSQ